MNVRICPQCKSTDTSPSRASYLEGALFGVPEHFVCNACGHQGLGFPETEVELPETPVSTRTRWVQLGVAVTSGILIAGVVWSTGASALVTGAFGAISAALVHQFQKLLL